MRSLVTVTDRYAGLSWIVANVGDGRYDGDERRWRLECNSAPPDAAAAWELVGYGEVPYSAELAAPESLPEPANREQWAPACIVTPKTISYAQRN